MKFAIALQSNYLSSKIHPLFGRCDFFCMYDSIQKTLTYLPNQIQFDDQKLTCPVAEALVDQNIDCAVGGAFSPKTSDLLLKNKIKLIIPLKDMNLEEFIKKIKE